DNEVLEGILRVQLSHGPRNDRKRPTWTRRTPCSSPCTRRTHGGCAPTWLNRCGRLPGCGQTNRGRSSSISRSRRYSVRCPIARQHDRASRRWRRRSANRRNKLGLNGPSHVQTNARKSFEVTQQSRQEMVAHPITNKLIASAQAQDFTIKSVKLN